MTDKEKAIDFLECRRAYYTSLSTDPSPYVKATKVCDYTLAESANACLMAIEALEQEPCKDAISRQAVLETIFQKPAFHGLRMDGSYYHEDNIRKAVEDLPPVTPQPEIGHWIDNHNNTISCDRCHTWFNKDDRYGYMHYCPNCGAKMKEVENG